MKIPIALSILPLPLLLIGESLRPAVHKGEFAPYFRFNNGVEVEGMECSADEWSKIQHALDNSVPGHVKQGTRSRHQKDLSNRRGHIFGDGCGALDRHRPEQQSAAVASAFGVSTPDWLRRFTTWVSVDQCAVDPSGVNRTLAALIPRLSPSCQAVVLAPLDISCAERVPCEISHFSLWNVDSDKLIVAKVPPSGGMFCANSTVAFEAISRFDVGPVYFTWHGPNGLLAASSTRVEYQAPYKVFGYSGSSVRGMKFPIGEFTMSATSENHAWTEIRFRTVQC